MERDLLAGSVVALVLVFAGCGNGAAGTSTDASLLLDATACRQDSVRVTDDAGVVRCVTQLPCEPFVCPDAVPGKVTLCGQLIDTETSARLDLGDAALCNPGASNSEGACSVALEFFDALQFAQDPIDTAALPYDRLRVSGCGYFAVEAIPAPALGFLALGADDVVEAGAYALTAKAVAVVGGERIDGLTVYVTRESTVQSWTQSAGMPLGNQTFAERGAYLPIYTHCGQPVPGVTVGGSTPAANAYYFSDTSPTSRATIDTDQTSTGANGSALLADGELMTYAGSGGSIGACAWPDDLADAIPGVLLAQEVHSVDASNGVDCSCP